MKNISKQILALAITPFIACAANAEDSYYAKGEVGLAMPKKVDGAKLKKSVIFGIEGGYKMNENFRFGLGLGMLNNVKYKDEKNTIEQYIEEERTIEQLVDFVSR